MYEKILESFATHRFLLIAVLVCSWFSAGLRVMDIRDPRHPKQLAYYNPGRGSLFGTNSPCKTTHRSSWRRSAEIQMQTLMTLP